MATNPICPNCKKVCKLAQNFCSGCGTRLTTTPSVAPPSVGSGEWVGGDGECCADWTPGITKLNGPIMLQSIRAGKDLYTGKPFAFCPWCGHRRPPTARFTDAPENP